MLQEAPYLDLIARRQRDLIPRGADYSVYAGEQHVGRIHETAMARNQTSWWWGVNGVVTSLECGAMYGYAETFDDAKRLLREAFDTWLVWAMALPADYLSNDTIAQQLKRIGAR